MYCRISTIGYWVVGLLAVLGWVTPSEAHEPVFSPGPHTLYKGGLSTSAGTSLSVPQSGETEIGLEAGAVYGITADLNLAVGVPIAVARQTHDGELTGVGDPVAQVKWRPWKAMAKGRIDSVSLIGGFKIPVGHHDLSPGNTGYTFGVTAAREHQRYYGFASARFITQTVRADGTRPGDVFLYDVATGIRPFILEYDQPDAVVLVELNGRTQGAARGGDETGATHHQALVGSEGPYHTQRQAHTGGAVDFSGAEEGGTELAVSPELLLSWGPVMLKGGIQLPFFDTFEAPSATPTYRVKSTLIVQF